MGPASSAVSLTSDFRTLAYFSVRLGGGDVFVRDLEPDLNAFSLRGPPVQSGIPPSPRAGAFWPTAQDAGRGASVASDLHRRPVRRDVAKAG